MDWKNVNLESSYERAQNILDPYNFETLLLEINCNLRDINKETVRAEAMAQIRAKFEQAIHILDENLENITQKAIEERNN
jgi:hypothetical protein